MGPENSETFVERCGPECSENFERYGPECIENFVEMCGLNEERPLL